MRRQAPIPPKKGDQPIPAVHPSTSSVSTSSTQSPNPPTPQPALLTDLQNLLKQYIRLCNLLQIIINIREAEVAVNCLSIIYGSVTTICAQLSFESKFHSIISGKRTTQPTLPHELIYLYIELWQQLSTPHQTEVRRLTYNLLVTLEEIFNITIPSLKHSKFKQPKHKTAPSLEDQIIYQPITILDPYILALRRNYYYPLAPEQPTMADNTQMEGQTDNESPKSSPTRNKSPASNIITVESSLAAIAELIKEVEAEDPPTETELRIPTVVEQGKKPNTHRFAIYRKQTYPVPGAPSNQLSLFKAFVKSIKAADQTAKILPIRSDIKIYALSTTDQITNLEHIGLSNYFKPYKKTQKTLSGDFHISTKLSFQELQDHPAFNTWLMHNGYNVLYNSCQTADMVKIGFLSRVRGFTLREDLQNFIMASDEWKAAPFHFRLYFDAFTAKNKTAHVLMIDVDRPNIELGIRFFQQWYNGTLTNSPNNLPYMFWPLFKKSYADEERLKIITDNTYHIGMDSVIGLTGLHPIDNLVKLVNGTYTSIRRLLLSVPTTGSTTGQLFVQVERQTANEWLLCCFHQQDTSKVIVRMNTLEDSLKKCVHPDHLQHLFTSAEGITFTTQVAPLAKGRNRLPRLEVPTYTTEYVTQSMQRLYTPTPKRQATDMTLDTSTPPIQTTPVPRAPQTTYAEATAHALIPLVTPVGTGSHPAQAPDTVMQDLQAKTQEHSNTLAELRQCCADLATSQQRMATNITVMNKDINTKFSELVNANLKFNERFNDMANAIESLRSHSPTRPLKFYKDGHHSDINSFHG